MVSRHHRHRPIRSCYPVALSPPRFPIRSSGWFGDSTHSQSPAAPRAAPREAVQQPTQAVVTKFILAQRCPQQLTHRVIALGHRFFDVNFAMFAAGHNVCQPAYCQFAFADPFPQVVSRHYPINDGFDLHLLHSLYQHRQVVQPLYGYGNFWSVHPPIFAQIPGFVIPPLAKGKLTRKTDSYFTGPPDLIIEVISEDSVSRDRINKFEEYEDAGVAEYWIIDPRPRRRRADFYILGTDGKYQPVPLDAEGVYRSKVLPGFWLNINWLWAEPLPKLMPTLKEIAG